MKLHRMDLSAFGPFAQPAQIDFDALGTDGLFLISGPTGAGKTSILDAVCFALYGRVPGQRNDAHELRTQGVPADVPTRVTLTFTVRGHTYKVERGPAYERPAKRGKGTTTQRATAALFELKDDDWAGLSRTNQEVSLLMQEAIGLSADQFTKIIMLPQGQFAQFLKAGPQEREPILQQLFGTERFARVERILAEQATEARSQLARIGDDRCRLITAALAAAELPENTIVPPAMPDAGDVLAGYAVALDELRQRVGVTRRAEDMAAADAEQATDQAAQAERRTADAARLRVLHELRERLNAAEPEIATAQALVARHATGAELAPLLREADRAQVAKATARQTCDEARAAVQQALADLGLDTTRTDEQITAVAEDDVEGWRAAAAATTRLTQDLQAAADMRAHVSTAARQLSDGTQQLDAATERAHEAAATLADLDPQSLADERVTNQQAQCEQLDAEAAQARKLMTTHAAAVQTHTATVAQEDKAISAETQCRENFNRIREERLDAQAAQLALQLSPGAACPVCGSTDHPRPAAPAPADITQEAETTARTAWESAAQSLRTATAERADAAAQLQAAANALKDTDGESAAERARAGREKLRSLEAERDHLSQQHTKHGAAVQALQTRVQEAQQVVARAQREHDEATAALAALEQGSVRHSTQAISALGLDVPGDPTVAAALAADLDALVQAGARLLTAGHDDRAATTRAHDRTAELDDALAESPFGDAQALREELHVDTKSAAARVDQHRSDEIRAAQISEEPAVGRAQHENLTADQLTELVAATQTALSAARERAHTASRAAAVAGAAADRVAGDRAGFLAGMAEAEELMGRDGERVRLAELVQATTSDNTKRMTLSSYALLTQFIQVTENASDRLATMTRGRFRLVHDVALHKREKRAGLGLLVADGFTQTLRDPRTLSGGESFMAALALALGLADTVAAHHGGIELDTLFIDEGFGSLDPDALAEVLTVLDELRAGGRTVGIISHVQSMQGAIPSRLVVAPSPTGSTLSVAKIG